VTAAYPTTVKSFTTKVDFTDTVLAAHVNNLQEEVVAVQTELGTDVAVGSGWIGVFDSITTNWNTLKDRLANMEYGIQGALDASIPTGGSTGQVLTKTSNSNYAVAWQTIDALPSQSGNAGKYLTTNGITATWANLATNADDFSQFLLAGC
jgi:hypothetical protein